ncbi:unnamed protein product [Vitrella brassicaformis CCMP3155]|uniref:Uncharacterized protein n=1 Tax=Vitrella brassicaformis (strain CCMP3155) TaxID=1169540 RepID=A0A0G4GG64_VITBC|nr:unnamed protein product [Vitrella brassicaformis CCMP3155]|eukprot:CEM28612.1 unnamed protein product [Vitrella brassicaformis CCMP3155]
MRDRDGRKWAVKILHKDHDCALLVDGFQRTGNDLWKENRDDDADVRHLEAELRRMKSVHSEFTDRLDRVRQDMTPAVASQVPGAADYLAVLQQTMLSASDALDDLSDLFSDIRCHPDPRTRPRPSTLPTPLPPSIGLKGPPTTTSNRQIR